MINMYNHNLNNNTILICKPISIPRLMLLAQQGESSAKLSRKSSCICWGGGGKFFPPEPDKNIKDETFAAALDHFTAAIDIARKSDKENSSQRAQKLESLQVVLIYFQVPLYWTHWVPAQSPEL